MPINLNQVPSIASVPGLQDALDAKASNTSVNSGLSVRPLTSYVDAADAFLQSDINTRATTSAMNTALAAKADASALSAKADTSSVTAKAAKLVTLAAFNTSAFLALGMEDKLQDCSSVGGITVTVPANASVAFPVGTQILFVQSNTGAVTFAPAGGVTINSRRGLVTTGQFAVATLVKTATNYWLLTGDLGS